MSIEKLSTNASLKQVMDKFEEISLQDFSSINIITSSELPTNGKENQICIITSTPANNFIITSKFTDKTNAPSDIIVYLGNDDTASSDALFSVKSGKVTHNYYFNKVRQNTDRLASYACQNSQWLPLTIAGTPIFENGIFLNSHITGVPPVTTSTSKPSYLKVDGNITSIYTGRRGGYYRGFGFPTLINFTALNKIKVTAKRAGDLANAFHIAASTVSRDAFETTSITGIKHSQKLQPLDSYNEYAIDVSSWTGTAYLQIYNDQGSESGFYISEIIME